MNKINLNIDDALHGQRIDLAIASTGVELSRRKIRQIIDAGGVYINNKRVRVASRQVHRGDKVRVEYNLATLKKLKLQNFAFTDKDILYFDDGIIAVNKPPGLPSQATVDQSVLHVVPCLQAYLQKRGEKPPHLVLVHRLDKETSGVLLLATTVKMGEALGDMFRSRSMEKLYHAVTWGIPKQENFAVECYLSAIEKKIGLVRPVRSGGKLAQTDFTVIGSNKKYGTALVACRPKTGRSHQIRVHLDMSGCPIVGDKRYGHVDYSKLPKDLIALSTEYHFLHAMKLAFVLPGSTKRIELTAPYPKNFAAFVGASGLAPGAAQHEKTIKSDCPPKVFPKICR